MTELQNTGLLKTETLVGKPVISLAGEEVGTVSRVVVDPAYGKVVGLTVNIKGLFKSEKAVKFESVNSFGSYAVTVETSSIVVPMDSLPTIDKLAKDHNLHNMRIITPDGKLLGTIDDFFFNPANGQIEKYILTGGIVKNLFKGRASIPATSVESIGKDVIIAKTDTEDLIQKEESGLQDSLDNLIDDLENWKGDLENWKDDFEKIWEKTRVKASEISKVVGENLKEAAQTGKGKGKDILSKTGEILSEKRNRLITSYEKWRNQLQTIKNKPNKPLEQKDIDALIGLKAGTTIITDSGLVIIEENSTVSQDIVDLAQKEGKIKELLISVATRDLEDQIQSIEKDNE